LLRKGALGIRDSLHWRLDLHLQPRKAIICDGHPFFFRRSSLFWSLVVRSSEVESPREVSADKGTTQPEDIVVKRRERD
jgi:hypothetical protein